MFDRNVWEKCWTQMFEAEIFSQQWKESNIDVQWCSMSRRQTMKTTFWKPKSSPQHPPYKLGLHKTWIFCEHVGDVAPCLGRYHLNGSLVQVFTSWQAITAQDPQGSLFLYSCIYFQRALSLMDRSAFLRSCFWIASLLGLTRSCSSWLFLQV